MTLKDIIRLVTPPVFTHLAKRMCGDWPAADYGLSGDYRSWDEAMAASTGYDSEIILEKTRTALFKVKSAEAAYERDSVLFDEIHYVWPVLAGLLWVAARSGGRLNVIDIGGSLGSSYYQNRAFLSTLPGVRWNIIEQSKHVGIGKAHFEDDYLRFYSNITECLAATQPNVILLSSVLQYLEHPFTVLNQIQEISCDHIIIDRTPFWDGPTDRLCVQTVPPSIYPASYPSWIFSRQQFYSNLHDDWHVMVTFDDPDKLAGPVKFAYQGVIIARKEKIS